MRASSSNTTGGREGVRGDPSRFMKSVRLAALLLVFDSRCAEAEVAKEGLLAMDCAQHRICAQ